MDFKPLVDFLDNYLPMLGIPGSDTLVYRNHEPIFRHTVGYDDIRFGTPARNNALYNMYSITKVSLATSAMQLIERGEIMLNDPLYAYIPEYRDVKVKRISESGEEIYEDARSPILIRHLLSMTSGLGYTIGAPSVLEEIERTGGRAPTVDIARALAKEPLSFHPGESFKYSFSHDVMGAVIEIVSGMKLSEYMKTNIFEPLGMENTGFDRSDEVFDRVAEQYQRNTDGTILKMDKRVNRFVFGTEYESGGAGLISSVSDQILLADALASGGVGKNGERILSKFAIDVMRTNMLNSEAQAEFNRSTAPGGKQGYGYGLGVRVNVDPASAGNLAPKGEFGWDGAMASYLSADPTTGLSVFHAEHVTGFSSHPLVHPRLRNLVYCCVGE